jgi:hypothetical protein
MRWVDGWLMIMRGQGMDYGGVHGGVSEWLGGEVYEEGGGCLEGLDWG